jgi:hypothetical protein
MRSSVARWIIALGQQLARRAAWARDRMGTRQAQFGAAAVAVALCVMIMGIALSHGSSARPRNQLAIVSDPTSLLVASSTSTPEDTTTPSDTATVALPTSSDTPTASATGTLEPTQSPTASDTRTPTPTPTRTPSSSNTPSVVPSVTASPTVDRHYLAEDTLEGTGPGPAGPLSGLPTRPEWSNRRLVAVVIDNYAPDARPQAGLNRASLVYETLAEGGVTRLMAVFLERDAPIVGPVRSARIYFDAWASGLHAIYAHAGGNSDALYQLLDMPNVVNVDDLNLMTAPGPQGPPFVRSPYRAAPHNLYTNTTQLRAFAAQSGASITGSFPASLPHRVPSQPFHRPSTAWIDVGLSSYAYNVHWLYDRDSNSYRRYVEGVAQADSISGRVIAPSNVVVLFTPVTPDHDAFTPEGVNVHATGSGPALYFRDGQVVNGTWQKAETNSPLELLDAQGKPQQFNPGQTWIDIVAQGSPVTYGSR